MDEGVIKYQLAFTPGPALAASLLAELIAWQRILHALGLLGRDPERYGGLAYGNLSIRLPDDLREQAEEEGEEEGGDDHPQAGQKIQTAVGSGANYHR